MRRSILILSALILCSTFGGLHASDVAPRVEGLRCEYLVNPLGLDVKHPCLSWKLNDARRGVAQSALPG